MRKGISRRSLLVGGGVGVGLVVAWGLLPRGYRPNLPLGPGEHMLDAFVKVGEDGRIVVAVPQAEMGQGVWTALPQILADELGADWRTIAVEPAPIGPLYANTLVAEEAADALAPALAGDLNGIAHELARREALMVTARSTSVRAFEPRLREAGAIARALLCMAAAERWRIDWRACDTEAGFAVRGEDRLRFGELAARAAQLHPPSPAPLRDPGAGKLVGRRVPRLDAPGKIDGSARFAADVRLPDLLYASIRHAPAGGAWLGGRDLASARKTPGVHAVIERAGWIACVASNWWAADRALQAITPRFIGGTGADDASIERALRAALAGPGGRFAHAGDLSGAFGGQEIFTAEYRVPFAPHANPEPPAATARMTGDRLEVWAPTQAPAAMRARIAEACGLGAREVTLFPMPVGGGFGRALEADVAVEAAIIARRIGRPVQLMWSREEELAVGPHRPPALARMSARMLAGGIVTGWQAQIAAPATALELERRVFGRAPHAFGAGDPMAVAGARPPYDIPALAIDHHPTEIGVPTGSWRSDAHGYTAFFTECFVDELAHRAGVDPFSFRLRMLGGNPRLAHCLATAASAADWDGGGAGSGQGLAVHSAFGGHVAVVAQARLDDGRPKVDRLTAAIDCGRVIHPEIVLQQIEGGLLWGLAQALGDATGYSGGRATAPDLAALRLPRLADAPEIEVRVVSSGEAPGGVGELGVPAVAPAVANAIATVAGGRLRTLPLALA